MTGQRGPRIGVFGAGAFGGWTALELVRRGARVTLVDAWGPGNVRSSSGGETRIIRAGYGARVVYTRLAARALELWRAYDAQWQRGFLRTTGVLWMFGADERFRDASATALRAEGIPVEEHTPYDAARRYPQVSFEGIGSVLLEPEGGYLLARRACEHVVERFVGAGGTFVQAAAATPLVVDDHVHRVPLIDGRHVEADAFVFACGPWLGTLFPDVIGSLIASTRQEVFYFGAPAGDTRFGEEELPAWIEVDAPDHVFYGVPGNAHRGFKIADDAPGPPFEPTTGDRAWPTASAVTAARRFIARRFPDVGTAPLVGLEVCQYESTPDAHFLIDRHPAAQNVWIAGGGSGHGFKMGPAVGEMLSTLVLADRDPDPLFRLGRFGERPSGGWRVKWS